ncbi:mevalonate kinase [Candidatus Gottesmanbacteria bacterium]|nr:mevalonate kinase [Candidatus Gottesmanbacteria bacterium]
MPTDKLQKSRFTPRVIVVSSPGKLMLLGEHAVVYGYPCIATAVDQRMKATITGLEEPVFELEAADVDVHGYKKPFVDIGKGDIPKGAKFVEIALQNFLQKNPMKGGVRVETSSEFSSQFGFGSSSASTVCTVKALSELFGVKLTPKDIFDISYKTVLDVQGKGSGFDVAAAIYGGTFYFVTAGKVIESLAVEELPLIVGYTGVKADTTTLIKQVAQKKEKYPAKVERIFQAIAKLVEEAKVRMLEGDWERAGKLMDFNQEYLRDLGVSSEKLEALIGAAKKAGAWGAKLSGAGGGDCMIALARSNKREAISNAITEAGGQVIGVYPNAEGVRIETTDDQNELFIVVDKNDKVLGYRSRYDCHHDTSLVHRTVGVVVFNEEGKVLLQKRSSTKDMGAGLWGTSCAGHVRKGQEYEEALHRELVEELGVDMSVKFVTKEIVADEDETEMAGFYKGVYNGPFKPNLDEIERVEFFSPRELVFKIASREIVLTKWALVSLQKAGVLS